jgi:hypothetical protein
MTGLSTGGVSTQEGPVILIGYEYRLQLQAEADFFPEAATFTGQLRSTVTDSTVLATLSTANGGVLRHDDCTLEIVVAADVTAALIPGSVVVDFVRIDLTPERPLGFSLEIPVQQPVTRGL